MKKILLFAAAAMLVGCITDPNVILSEDQEDVNIFFAPAKAPAQTETTPALSDFCTHLDVWFIEGGETIDVHQSSTDADFGTLSLTLNKTKTYQMVAVAHKCAGNATLSNNIITFPDDKITQSMVGKVTFSPASDTDIDAVMTRIVGQFRFDITDAVPDNVAKIDFSISQTGTRWNISTNAATNVIDREVSVAVTSRKQDGSATVIIYIIPDDLTQAYTYDIHVAAKTSADVIVEERDFDDVQIRAGYKTTYSGQFFVTTPMSFGFTVSDWSEYDVVTY